LALVLVLGGGCVPVSPLGMVEGDGVSSGWRRGQTPQDRVREAGRRPFAGALHEVDRLRYGGVVRYPAHVAQLVDSDSQRHQDLGVDACRRAPRRPAHEVVDLPLAP